MRRVREDSTRREHVALAETPDIRAHHQVIIEQALVVVRAQRRPVDRRATEHAFLVEIAQREPPVVGCGGVRRGDVMFLADSGMVYQTEPICSRVAELRLLSGRAVLCDCGAELRRIQHAGQSVHQRVGGGTRVLDVHAASPGLRRDQDHAVRSIRSVDRCCGGVAQHRDVLDVAGVDRAERVAADREPATGARRDWHPVDDVERLAAGVDRGGTTDADRQPAARLVVIDNLHAGDFALNEFLRVDDAPRIELRVRNLRYRSGDVADALLAIPGNHDCSQVHGLTG